MVQSIAEASEAFSDLSQQMVTSLQQVSSGFTRLVSHLVRAYAEAEQRAVSRQGYTSSVEEYVVRRFVDQTAGRITDQLLYGDGVEQPQGLEIAPISFDDQVITIPIPFAELAESGEGGRVTIDVTKPKKRQFDIQD